MGIRREWGESIWWSLALFGCCIAVLIGIAAFQTDARAIPPSALSSPPPPAMEIASAAANAPSTAVPAAASISERPANAGRQASSGESGSDAAHASIRKRYGRIPMHFEPNVGQTADEVRYLARGPGYTLFLTDEEAVLVLRKGLQDKARRDDERNLGASLPTDFPMRGKRAESETQPPAVVRMRLEGADRNATPKVEGLERQPGVSNYLLGKDPAKWRSGVPHYVRVRYQGVYPGIDLVFYGNPRQLEYDFVVAAGADPERIRLSFQGADGMRINADGNLVLAVAGGELVQRAPRIYQQVNGMRRPVAGGYRLLSVDDKADRATDAEPDRSVGFRLAAYDGTRSLVIDPVLEYSTYLGGSEDGTASGIAVDAPGNAYVAGYTDSLDFPVANARYSHHAGDFDVFVAKLDAEGQGLDYVTYLGGSGWDSANGIAVDAAGNAYVAGGTESPNLPTVNARYSNHAGGFLDAFVAKLDPAGERLVYATYLGGSGADMALDIAADAAGNAYVAGATYSSDFPAVNARYPNHASGERDAFVAKLDPIGQGPVYATYLGGSGSDSAYGIIADAKGNAYVTGFTNSPDFPTVNARYPKYRDYGDAFVVKLDPEGQGPVYATYLGGSGWDEARGITADVVGNVYVAGLAESSDFPTVNALYPNHAGGFLDAFVTKLDPKGQGPVYSTYLGGSESEAAFGIAVDDKGNAYVAGTTESPDFPAVNALYPNLEGYGDAFVAKLATEGQGTVYATYLGGREWDFAWDIAADAMGNAYVVGETNSPDFPTVNALYPNYAGGESDAFVARLTDGVNIRGNVLLADGTPICAMVLANGQYMFSCDGAGSYELSVPLDENGEITLFSFADGFAPFRVTAAPENLPAVVQMQTAAPNSPSIHMLRTVECSGTNQVRIDGTVQSESWQPLCALVLANGQHMFSCDASQGMYDLDVPIDENGQVTIFGFADGFQPYSETFVAPDCTGVPSY